MEPSKVLPFSKINTDRLVIRKLKASDAAAIFALHSNEQNRKYLSRPKMSKIIEAREFIKKMKGGIAANDWLYWGICLKDRDDVIGTICLWHFAENPFKADVGYELHPAYQGKGIMNEALIAIMDYAFRVLKLEYLEACTSRNNLESIRLLEKNKFSFVRELSKQEVQSHEKELGLCIYAIKNSINPRSK